MQLCCTNIILGWKRNGVITWEEVCGGWMPVTVGNAGHCGVTLGALWGGPRCSSVPQPHSLPCQRVWDRLRRMNKRLGTKMSAEPWGDCIEPSATKAVLGRETTWSCCGLWQGQDPTSSFLLVGHPTTYVEHPYYPTAQTNYMLCLCEIASFLWPCCTYKPQAFFQNKGCHCKSFGEEDSFLVCHPDHALVLLIGSKMEKKKPWINRKILSLVFLRKGMEYEFLESPASASLVSCGKRGFRW